jgi:HlyD family secretion protein
MIISVRITTMMNNMIKTALEWMKMHKKTVAAITLVALVVVVRVAGNGGEETTTATAEQKTIIQEVSAIGTLTPASDATLAFDRTGRVTRVPVSVGDRVSRGAVLAAQDSSELQANRASAAASLAEAVAILNQTGRTASEGFLDARSAAVARIKDAYIRSDDAIRNSADQYFRNPRQSSTYIEFSFTDGSTQVTLPVETNLRLSINSSRASLEGILTSWERSIAAIPDDGDLAPYLSEAERNLSTVRSFLDDLALAANSLVAPEFKYESTVNSYKSSISAARNQVLTATTNLIAARQALTAAPNPDGAGTFETVAQQQARVDSARARVAAIDAQIAATLIISPIDGIVTSVNAEEGEILTAGTEAVSVISAGDLEIKANVSEVNIGRVSVGNPAMIEFDAFPGKTFSARVVSIDPAQTIVENVVNYEVTIALEQGQDTSALKSGLTASVRIVTAEKTGVLAIPRFAVFVRQGKNYVDVVAADGVIEEREITTGISGNDGMIEVVSGLSEGEAVRISSGTE